MCINQDRVELFDYDNSVIQQLVTIAYTEIIKPEEINKLDKGEFWTRLPLRIRVAVFVGNLNYQVENGGFDQWIENGYSNCAEELIAFLEKLPKTGPEIASIIKYVVQVTGNLNDTSFTTYVGVDLDILYYERELSLLAEVETILKCYSQNDEFENWFTTAQHI